ncbi:MAG: alkaline phosphatase PafA [Chitinophagales bacterium]
MFNKISFFFLFAWLTGCATAQTSVKTEITQPKLIVGIVVDQMAYNFLYRYWDNYSDGGFKRLVNGGFSCENAYFNYIPTYTGPGHTCIYTGTVPAIHGVVSNDWFDKNSGKYMYCAQDNTVETVGASSASGKMSPANMLTTTICDELKLFNNMHSKVIGISLKDRGAILPAGHLADAAYWYDGYSSAWISSTYYMQELPAWVSDFNSKNIAVGYLNKGWDLLLSPEMYKNSTDDNVSWEGTAIGEAAPVFPHRYIGITNTEAIKATPMGNTFTKDFAVASLKKEELGKDIYTDFLAVSFSSTDYVGHRYGNYALEIEDTYIRLDKDLADFFTILDTEVGSGNYLVFLTADHGVATSPAYAKHLNIPSGGIYESAIQKQLDSILASSLGQNSWIRAYTNQNIYLNDSLLAAKKIPIQEIYEILYTSLIKEDGIANVILTKEITTASIPEKTKQLFINGMYAKRSGDIFIQYEPNWMDVYGETGTTHGSHYSYDTHVPLLWYGWKIPKGKTNRNVAITDIAATLAALLHIQQPNGCIGDVITEIK